MMIIIIIIIIIMITIIKQKILITTIIPSSTSFINHKSIDVTFDVSYTYTVYTHREYTVINITEISQNTTE